MVGSALLHHLPRVLTTERQTLPSQEEQAPAALP